MPLWFSRLKYSSFVRGISGHGFTRIRSQQGPATNNAAIFHQYFVRDQPELALRINKNKRKNRSEPALSTTVGKGCANNDDAHADAHDAASPDPSVQKEQSNRCAPTNIDTDADNHGEFKNKNNQVSHCSVTEDEELFDSNMKSLPFSTRVGGHEVIPAYQHLLFLQPKPFSFPLADSVTTINHLLPPQKIVCFQTGSSCLSNPTQPGSCTTAIDSCFGTLRNSNQIIEDPILSGLNFQGEDVERFWELEPLPLP